MPFFGEKSNLLDYSQIRTKLTSQNIDANYIDPPHEYPLLHTAVIENIPQACRALVDHYREKYSHSNEKFTFKQAINVIDGTGQTALHHACNQGNFELVKYLMDAGASDKITDHIGNLPLHFAAIKFNFPITEYLLTKRQLNFLLNLLGTESNGDGGNENYEQASVNTRNKEGITPLLIAILARATDVEAEDNKEKVIHALLASFPEKQFDEEIKLSKVSGSSYLEISILNKLRLSIIEKILKKSSVQIDKQNVDGLTALHLAVMEKDKELVALLLENNADISKKNNSGKTALHLAAEQKYFDPEVLELLLEHASSLGQVDLIDNDRNTAFHTAVSHCDETIAKLFIDYGANINAQNIVGNTPLHLAIFALAGAENDKDSIRHQEVYFYLNDFADRTIRNGEKKTAEEILTRHLTPNYEFTDVDLDEALTENNLNDYKSYQDNNSHARIATKLNTAAIGIITTTPASTARSESDYSAKPLLPALSLKNTKPKGLFEKVKNFLISSWRKFKTTRMGRFVKRHPYISAAIFAIALTGFVTLCVFVPPIAAKIPILLAVKAILTATNILTKTSALLDPIAKTAAMLIPAVAVVITGCGIKFGPRLYSYFAQNEVEKKTVIFCDVGISKPKDMDLRAAPQYKISKDRIVIQKYKSKKKDFSIRDYLPSFLISCWDGGKAQNGNAVVYNGKDKSRSTSQESIESIENPTYDVTRRESDLQRMSFS